jgi:hypothetical protein
MKGTIMKNTPREPMHPAWLALLALASGGVLVVLGHALSAPQEGTGEEFVARFAANWGVHFAGMLLTTIGALLFIPGIMGVLRVLNGRSTVARVGGTLAGIGAAALGVGDGALTLMAGVLVHEDRELAVKVAEVFDRSNLAGLPFMFAPLFVFGLILLGAGLIRIGGVLKWPGAVLIVGSILVFASGSGGLAAAVTLTPLAAGCVSVAWVLSRQPAAMLLIGRKVAPAIDA